MIRPPESSLDNALAPPPVEGAHAPQQHAGGLALKIGLGVGLILLAMVLVLGLGLSRMLGDSAASSSIAASIRPYLVMWGVGSLALAVLAGVLVARLVSAPFKQLSALLEREDFSGVMLGFGGGYNSAEVVRLANAIGSFAAQCKRREADLAASERKFREAFDLVGIGLIQVDAANRLVIVNQRFCQMLGYPREALLGRLLSDFVHPDDRGADDIRSLAVHDGDLPVSNRERRYLRQDGSLLWAQCSGVMMRDSNGQPLFALCSIEDVSRYHNAQETLKSLNESLRAIVETSPLAIYAINLAGLVTLWNPAAERVFGIKANEILGSSSPWMTGAGNDAILKLREKILAGQNIHDIQMTWEVAGRSAREISLSAAALRAADASIVGILITCTDITDIKATSHELDVQLHFIRELLEVIPNPIFYRGADGRYLGFNRAWEVFFGVVRDDWIGKTPGDKYGNASASRFEIADAEVLASGKTAALEEVIADSSGVNHHIIKQISRFTSPNGAPAGIIGVLTDITAFKQAEEALRASEGRFQALTESAMDIVSVLDREGRILYQSPSVRHLLGFDPQDMIGLSKFDMVHPDDAELMRASFRELVEKGTLDKPVEFRVRASSGEWRNLEAIGKNCLDIPAVGGIILNVRDVTDRRAIEARIQHLAFHDALTGLPNRLLIQDRISQAISRAQRSAQKFAVMFIDIDNFKNINDTLGHDAGDDLLRGMAERLLESVRQHDTIARQGGDEFIVLLDELEGHRGATRVAQKILEALRAPFKVAGLDQHVSGSIGLALYPDDGRDAATLLKNADTAMFHGKALGKNTYQFFTPQMNIAVKRRAAMESNLRAAVKQGDFSMVYQPQIDLNTGEIVALEALVRWVSEDSGMMMPSEFIPLAEETGLISELGRWVLLESCRQNKAWQDMGLPARRIAVNLSARQLMDKGFIDAVAGILAETGLEAHYLELEITESQVMRQGEGSVMLLNQIADMGVHIAVDDFGTGYSSLSYLKRLPIGTLKIDQSFIRDITVDPNDTAIVVAIINMAKSLDLQIVAEGIETAGQLALLRSHGCGVGQGFYFSVPLSAKDLLPMLARHSLFADLQQA